LSELPPPFEWGIAAISMVDLPRSAGVVVVTFGNVGSPNLNRGSVAEEFHSDHVPVGAVTSAGQGSRSVIMTVQQHGAVPNIVDRIVKVHSSWENRDDHALAGDKEGNLKETEKEKVSDAPGTSPRRSLSFTPSRNPQIFSSVPPMTHTRAPPSPRSPISLSPRADLGFQVKLQHAVECKHSSGICVSVHLSVGIHPDANKTGGNCHGDVCMRGHAGNGARDETEGECSDPIVKNQ